MKKNKVFQTIASVIASSLLICAFAVPIHAEVNSTDSTDATDFSVNSLLATDSDADIPIENMYLTSPHFDYHDRMFIDEGESTYIDFHYYPSNASIEGLYIEWYVGGGTTIEQISDTRYELTAGEQGLYYVGAIVRKEGVEEDIADLAFYMAVRWNVELGIKNITLKKGVSFPLGQFASPFYMVQRSTWTSFDESIATVDQNGNVTAVGVGTTYIELVTPFIMGPVYMSPGRDECQITVIP